MKWTDQGGGKEFAQAPAGTHEAICIGVIDLGTQTGSYQGQPTVKRQVLIQWELPNELMEDGKPFIVSKFYTASLNEKATLRHDLESWRGRAFTEQELAGFESKNILQKPCLLSIIHNDAGKARVASVMAIPKGMKLPGQVNPTTHFSLDSFDGAVFDKIGKGLQEMIRKSPEFQSLGKKTDHFADMSDDIPEEASIPF